jgi:hypothetical protein
MLFRWFTLYLLGFAGPTFRVGPPQPALHDIRSSHHHPQIGIQVFITLLHLTRNTILLTTVTGTEHTRKFRLHALRVNTIDSLHARLENVQETTDCNIKCNWDGLPWSMKCNMKVYEYYNIAWNRPVCYCHCKHREYASICIIHFHSYSKKH